jgi:ABC-type glycerol-3-phosphate transport system substrate-binding protein
VRLAATGLVLTIAVTLGGVVAIPISSTAQEPGSSVDIAIPGWAFSLNPQFVLLAQQYNEDHPDQPPVTLGLSARAQTFLDTSRFLLDAQNQTSTFDAWFGFTPVVDMIPMVTGDVVEPWDAYIADDIRADIFEANVAEGSHEGSFYSWPQVVSSPGLNYRPSILAAAGWDQPPETWDELLQAAKDVTEKVSTPDRPVYGAAFDLQIVARQLVPFAVSLAGEATFDENGYIAWDDPQVAEALGFLQQLAQYAPPDIYSPGGDDAAFKTSQAAMLIKYSDAGISGAKAFGLDDYAFAPLPKAPGSDVSRSAMWGTGFVLFKYADNKDIAADFVDYLVRSEAYQQGWIDSGQPLVLKSWYEKLGTDAPAWMQAYPEILSNASFLPNTPHFITMSDAAMPWIVESLRNGVDPAEALASAGADFQRQIGEG